MIMYIRGCSGPEVEQLQLRLKALGFYLGPIDGAFGGGTESAVRSFQRAKSLAVDGKVGPRAWAELFDGQAIPAPAILSKPLSERCLALTVSFETGRMVPDSFSAVAGNFDGQGVSFGVLQWNFGQRSLQPLLKDMNAQHSALVKNVFDEYYEEFVRVLDEYSFQDQMKWARSIQSPDRHRVYEPWYGLLRTLGRTRECQDLQVRYASARYTTAVDLHRAYELWSERGVAVMFDIVVQNGTIRPAVRKKIQEDFRLIPTDTERSALEVEKMRIIAHRRADAARAAFREDVRSRKLCCANGEGVVHRTHFDLEHQFGIALREVG